jgi:hypothetical protein
VRRVEDGELCAASSFFLDEVWSEGHAPYPFTMSVVDGRYASGWTKSSRAVPPST